MSWTDERIEKLTKMWEGGATASQIAEELGDQAYLDPNGVNRRFIIQPASCPTCSSRRARSPASPQLHR